MIIHSNGSKWAGQQPDDVATLLQVMETHALDARFAGKKKLSLKTFFFPVGDRYMAFGNFLSISHVFRITGTADEMMPIKKAIAANIRKFHSSNNQS